MPLRGFRRGEAIEGHGPIITDLSPQHLLPPLPHIGICGYTALHGPAVEPPSAAGLSFRALILWKANYAPLVSS